MPPAPTTTQWWTADVPTADLTSFPSGLPSVAAAATSDGGASTGTHAASTFFMWGDALSTTLLASSYGVAVPHVVSFAFRAASSNAVRFHETR